MVVANLQIIYLSLKLKSYRILGYSLICGVEKENYSSLLKKKNAAPATWSFDFIFYALSLLHILKLC